MPLPLFRDSWTSQPWSARGVRAGWIHAIGNGVVLALAILNLGGRVLGDVEDFIIPWGLVLSAMVGLGLALTGWYGGELSYRYLVGVDPRTSGYDRPARKRFE